MFALSACSLSFGSSGNTGVRSGTVSRIAAGWLLACLGLGSSLGVQAQAVGSVAVLAASTNSYTVQPGDTLLRIGARTGHDYQDIARWNGIKDVNKIAAGQVLQFRALASAPIANTAVIARPVKASPPLTTAPPLATVPPPAVQPNVVAPAPYVPNGKQAGVVEFSRGVGFAQTPGQKPRTLGRGLPLNETDLLTTAEDATAIVKLDDGTRMTVRPNSQMVIQEFHYKEGATDNGMVMRLLQGGLRTITGFISKASPNAARIVTRTATIGIRGTDFDARLCTKDCRVESIRVIESPRLNAVQASAKVVTVQGDMAAVDGSGTKRHLVAGGSLYPGETLETGAGSRAVLAFRDESRMTLGGSTRFKIDSFVFDSKNPTEGRFLVSLFRGSMRALTGLIGQSNHRNVSFNTPTATLGIRGTGLDLDCGTEGSCSFFTWLGSIEVTPNGQSALQVLQAGQGLFVGSIGIRPLTAPTLQDLERPDTVQVDMPRLFGAQPLDDGEEGLFVYVRDGHIEITTPTQTLHLGRGETGYAGSDGRTVRPLMTPLFLEFDRTPLPNSANPFVTSILDESGIHPVNMCR